MIAHRFFLVCFVLCLSLFFGVSVVFAQSAVGEARMMIAEGLKKCLVLETGRDACYAPLCEYEPGYLCAEDILDVAVEVAGPKKTMRILHDVMRSSIFAITSDGHLLSHIVGRATSRVFGSSGEHFLKCPSDFNNGCFHGFFEHTLPRSDSPVDVVASICENMPPETPPKERGYCYHGAGHVFMMQESHDLDRAIALCLQLSGFGPESCWQGAFMENAGEREWGIKKKNFREDDPLYPCYVVEDRFKPECYINHHGYLIRHHSQSWDELVNMCLGAGDWIESCIGGLSLMLGSEHWIGVVAREFEHLTDADHAERTGFFCNRLPDEYIPTCYSYAIPSFLNFGHRDLSMVSHVCSMASEEHRGDCFSRIGGYLTGLISTPQDKVQPCSTVPAEWRSVCFGDEYIQTKRVIEGGLPDIPLVEARQGDNQSSKQDILFFERIKRFFASILKSVTNAFTPTVSAHSGNPSDTELVRLAHPEFREGVEECLALKNGRGDCYASLCEYEPGYLCAEDLLHTATVTNGPEAGIQMLQEMIAHPLFAFDDANEGHSLVHVVGRITSQHFGGGGEVFLRCPTVLDYGCQHGFLEDALPKASSPAEAVTNICESLPEIPTIGRPNCYHGSGHGVMMNVSYNLHEAIAICDATSDPYSCSTGIMMENASGYASGRIQDFYPENNSFEENNPQAPCDTLTDTIHRRTCYRQHMPYLAKYFDYDLQEVVGVCLAAPTHTDVRDCVFGFGAYGIYDGIQASLLSGFAGDYMDKIIHMCDQFPEEHRMHCYIPAIDTSTIFYGVEQASDFCDKVDPQHLRECYRAIGDRHQSLVMNEEEKIERCAPVPEEYRIECTDPHRSRDGGQNTDTTPTPVGNVTPDGQGVESVVEGGEADGEQLFFLSLKRFFTSITQFVLHLFSQIAAAQTSSMSNNQLAEGVKRCLMLQERQNGQEDRAKCYATLCEYEPGYLCAEKILEVVTNGHGPETAMDVLDGMIRNSPFSFAPSSEGHNLAHTVGRTTAEHFGSNGSAFIRCPDALAYGCHHGFFEVALFTSGGDSAKAVSQICESMSDKPSLGKTSCYHGAGHGIMMNEGHDLDAALAVCDQLFNQRDTCYDGVFMEHINARNDLGAENNQFDENNPLAPCNVVDKKYRHGCYYRHGNYLFAYYNNSDNTIQDVINVCLNAQEHTEVCLTAVSGSLFLSNYHEKFIPGLKGSRADKANIICGMFPEEYTDTCYTVFAGETVIFHSAKDGSDLCMGVNEEYRALCFEKVIERIDDLSENENERAQGCTHLPQKYAEMCFAAGENLIIADDIVLSAVSMHDKAVQENSTETNNPFISFLKITQFVRDFFDSVSEYFSGTTPPDNLGFFSLMVKECLDMEEETIQCYAALCEYDLGYLCAEKIVETITALEGPARGIVVLKMLSRSAEFNLGDFLQDGHQLAHSIGRSAARNLGVTGDVFNQCPSDFSYGCHHGFFEGVAVTDETSIFDIMVSICNSFNDGEIFEKTNCYHASGHGIVMYSSYNLELALFVCDLLKNSQNRMDCKTGVFMENALGFVENRIPEEYNSFDKDNPLVPCSDFNEESDRNNCYSYHHRIYLPVVYSANIEDLINLCFWADEDEQLCFNNLAQALTTASGDVITHKSLPKDENDRAKRAAFLCQRFPKKYIQLCLNAAVFRFIDTDTLFNPEDTTKSARRFCESAGEHVPVCFAFIQNFNNDTDSQEQPFAEHCEWRWQYATTISNCIKNGNECVSLNDDDYFGDSVSLFGDTLAIGSYGDDDGGDAGAVYLFEQNAEGIWMYTLKISDNGGGDGLLAVPLAGNDRFGRGVSLYGNTLAVGAYYDNKKKGAVYLFERNTDGIWTYTLKISGDREGDGLLSILLRENAHFGASVSLYENTLAVGAYLEDNKGSVYLFERGTNDEWTYSSKLSGNDFVTTAKDTFGRAVSLYKNRLAVGMPRGSVDNRGIVYLFERDEDGLWNTILQFADANAADGEHIHPVALSLDDRFGSSVFLNGDALLVGAWGDDSDGVDTGAVYVFETDDIGVWTQTVKVPSVIGKENGNFGHGLSLYDDTMTVGASRNDNGGAVHIFKMVSRDTCLTE